ncbi:MAG: DUF1670 domain-containing protein [Candidatus Methanofastidiosia archaeon]|jgi:hypothetical protein
MSYREKLFNPLEKKSEQQIIAQRLRQDYGLIGDKVIEILSGDLLTWLKELNINAQTLAPGQTVWLAVDVSDKHHPHKRIEDTKLIPVKLTIHSHEDINLLLTPKMKLKDVIKHKIARLLTEAYTQGGVLTQTDLSVLLNISRQRVITLIAEYQKEYGIDLPYRGKVHDIGPAVSHKAAIVELMVKGYATPDAAKKMNHSIESCDRYYKDYKRVVKLGKSYSLLEISTLTDLSEGLIKEYIKLAEILCPI